MMTSSRRTAMLHNRESFHYNRISLRQIPQPTRCLLTCEVHTPTVFCKIDVVSDYPQFVSIDNRFCSPC